MYERTKKQKSTVTLHDSNERPDSYSLGKQNFAVIPEIIIRWFNFF
jgi:hypothetical protein